MRSHFGLSLAANQRIQTPPRIRATDSLKNAPDSLPVNPSRIRTESALNPIRIRTGFGRAHEGRIR